MSSSSPSSSIKRKIQLRSSDGEMFEVEEAVAMQSETIKSMMEVIPVSEVTGKTLSLIIIDFCKKSLEHHGHDDHLREWAVHLFQADQSAFYDLVLAAHHLKIKSLEDVTCQTVADILRGKPLKKSSRYFLCKNYPEPPYSLPSSAEALLVVPQYI